MATRIEGGLTWPYKGPGSPLSQSIPEGGTSHVGVGAARIEVAVEETPGSGIVVSADADI